jgi:hypothetical protein
LWWLLWCWGDDAAVLDHNADSCVLLRLESESLRLREIATKHPELQVLHVTPPTSPFPTLLLQRNFDLVMSQSTGLSGELDALREALARLQSSADQALADLSEKEADLRIQKRERFERDSKLYAASAEHDRMKSEAHDAAGTAAAAAAATACLIDVGENDAARQGRGQQVAAVPPPVLHRVSVTFAQCAETRFAAGAAGGTAAPSGRFRENWHREEGEGAAPVVRTIPSRSRQQGHDRPLPAA